MKKEIIEGNKLIDAFNDDVLQKCGWADSEMNYHSDWNNLMPVVMEIEAMGVYTSIEKKVNGDNWVTFDSIEENFVSKQWRVKSKIEAVWLAVVEFIKWYNQNK